MSRETTRAQDQLRSDSPCVRYGRWNNLSQNAFTTHPDDFDAESYPDTLSVVQRPFHGNR
jgi:hypothetical protein